MAAVWGLPPGQLTEGGLAPVPRSPMPTSSSPSTATTPKRAPWSIDLLPLILPENEWRQIAEGMAQRARLLDRILGDVYGEQRLISDGLLPPYLVYSNPGFLRPMRFVNPTGGPRTSTATRPTWCACRMASGAYLPTAPRRRRVRVTHSATAGYWRAPSGSVSRDAGAAPQPFLELWQASLQRIGAAHGDEARAVLLTPGPLQ